MRALALVLLLVASPASAQVAVIVGDSLVATQATAPQACCSPNVQGWAYHLPSFTSGVTWHDRAVATMSTATYLTYLGGAYYTATRGLNPDWVILSFGINDESQAVSTATYKANLSTYVADFRGDGAQVLFVTAPPWRYTESMYDEGGNATDLFSRPDVNMGDYATAMIEQAAAESPPVPVVNLYALATSWYTTLDFPVSHLQYGLLRLDGLCPPLLTWQCPLYDHLHWSSAGALRVAEDVAGGIRTGLPTLAPYLLARYRTQRAVGGGTLAGGTR